MSAFKEKPTKYSSFVNNKNRKKQANIQDTVDICHKNMMESFQKDHSNINKWNQKIEKYKIYREKKDKIKQWKNSLKELKKEEKSTVKQLQVHETFKDKVSEAEAISITNIINIINTHSREYLNSFFEVKNIPTLCFIVAFIPFIKI